MKFFKSKIKNLLLIFSVLLVACGIISFDPYDKSSDFPYMYVGNWGLDRIFVVDLSNYSIVDTLTGFDSILGLCSSLNGKRLYISTGNGSVNGQGDVYCIDLLTGEKTQIYDKKADIYIRPDNIPIIISYTPYDTIRQIGFLDTLTNDVSMYGDIDIFRGNYDFQNIAFDPINPVLYSWTNKFKLFSYDYFQTEVTKYFNSILYPFSMLISGDGGHLYSPRSVVDIDSDSLIGELWGCGSLALSNDGNKLYTTNTLPDHLVFQIGRTDGVIYIFDTHTFELIDSICVLEASNRHVPNPQMMICNKNSTIGYLSNITEILVIDLRTNQVIDVIDFGEIDVYIKFLAFGKGTY